jgi:hypothetical protein
MTTNSQSTARELALPALGPPPRRSSKLPTPGSVARLAAWLALVAASVLLAALLGLDVDKWLRLLWSTVSDLSAAQLAGGLGLATLQTCLVSLAWVGILRAAYPGAGVRYLPVLTCYAVAVALNGVLPANIGTVTMFFMLLAIVPGSTPAGIFSAYLVQKLLFTIVGVGVYAFLFLSVSGSFDIGLGGLHRHWLLASSVAAVTVGLVCALAVLGWHFGRRLWQGARQGGAILASPRRYLLTVALPELGGYAAKLALSAIFLAAYGIPVTVRSVVSVVGSTSIANISAVTPGGAGINQGLNTVALGEYASAGQATSYSVGQQLVTTTWNVAVAIVLVGLVFGWSGGRRLVHDSYGSARTSLGGTGERCRSAGRGLRRLQLRLRRT